MAHPYAQAQNTGGLGSTGWWRREVTFLVSIMLSIVIFYFRIFDVMDFCLLVWPLSGCKCHQNIQSFLYEDVASRILPKLKYGTCRMRSRKRLLPFVFFSGDLSLSLSLWIRLVRFRTTWYECVNTNIIMHIALSGQYRTKRINNIIIHIWQRVARYMAFYTWYDNWHVSPGSKWW